MPNRQNEELYSTNRFRNYKICVEKQLCDLVAMACRLFSVPIGFVLFNSGIYQSLKYIVGSDINQLSGLDLSSFEIDDRSDFKDFDFRKEQIPAPLIHAFPKAKLIRALPLFTNDQIRIGHLVFVSCFIKELNTSERNLLNIIGANISNVIDLETSVDILKAKLSQPSEKEFLHQSFLTKSEVGYLLIGMALEVVFYNDQMKRYLKMFHGVNVFKGMELKQIVSEESLRCFEDAFSKALNETIIHYERFADLNGSRFWFRILFEANYDEKGSVESVSYYVTDITRQKSYELQAVNQQEKLTRIAYIHSHDLRKPVATILGLINVFKIQDSPPDEQEIAMLEEQAKDLDLKIKEIVHLTHWKA